MLNQLKKNISTLFVILVGVMFIAVLIFCNWIHFHTNRNQWMTDVRTEIRSVGWNEFLLGNTGDTSMGDYFYCVVRTDGPDAPDFVINHFPENYEPQLNQYVENIIAEGKTGWDIKSSTYILKRRNSYLVLVDGSKVLDACLPVFAVSVILGVFGILFLIMGARMLSRWLVLPVEEMVQAEKKFMSNASHELKTPLTVISANAELLEDETGDNKHLQYIRQETARMTALVNRMLTLVRLDSQNHERPYSKFRVDEALLNVIYPMESVAYEKNIEMEIQVREGMQIVGDAEQIKSLMSILLDNAITYTADSGQIRIEADVHARKFYLKVSNTGDPIPKDIQEKLFERFYRQDEARTGDDTHFGLGLSIAKSIVSYHHGTIHVESSEGKNHFIVTLPAAGMSNYVNKK